MEHAGMVMETETLTLAAAPADALAPAAPQEDVWRSRVFIPRLDA